jgi:hypothetical protein
MLPRETVDDCGDLSQDDVPTAGGWSCLDVQDRSVVVKDGTGNLRAVYIDAEGSSHVLSISR